MFLISYLDKPWCWYVNFWTPYLFIYRVDIPVIIMGETGCGKTKLIDFMSKLQVPTALKDEVNTMIIVKVSGDSQLFVNSIVPIHLLFVKFANLSVVCLWLYLLLIDSRWYHGREYYQQSQWGPGTCYSKPGALSSLCCWIWVISGNWYNVPSIACLLDIHGLS